MLLALAATAAIMQSGMAQWAPPGSAAPGYAHTAAHGSADGIAAAAVDGAGGYDHEPDVRCGCTDCMDYFTAHTLAVPGVAAAPPPVPWRGEYQNSFAVVFVDRLFAPLTPPPR